MDDTKKFLSLGNFLFVQEEDIHTLVAAIEKHGNYKLGRSGIPRLFSPDSKVALEAFSHLALYLNDLQIIDLGDEDTSEKKGFSDAGGNEYGWPEAVAPDMDTCDPEKDRKIRSLNYLLTKSDAVPHAGLASQIECAGVYRQDNSRNIRYFGPDSREIHDALLAISVNLHHVDRGIDPDFEEWYELSNPIYAYGWPRGQIPNFRATEDHLWIQAYHRLKLTPSIFKENIYTVGRILAFQKSKPGGIQTAIEREGIYGFDGVGRVKHFSAHTAEIKVVELALAAYAKMLAKGIQPDFSKLDHDSLSCFGWPRNRLPDFVSIEAEPLPQPAVAGAGTPAVVVPGETEPVTVLQPQALSLAKRTASANANKANDTIVAALMAFIRGDLSPNHHPDYSSQDALIELFSNKLNRAYGMGERSWKTKFSAANKLRPELGLLPEKTEK